MHFLGYPRESVAGIFSDRLEFSLQFLLSDSRGVDWRPENRSRRFVRIDGPLWMPLYRKHEVIRGGPLERFDDSVLRRARDHPQSIPDDVRCLVMTGIDRDDKC